MSTKPRAKPSGARAVEPGTKPLLARVEDEYRWCATCSRSTKPVVIVATELGHTTIICRDCVRQLGEKFA